MILGFRSNEAEKIWHGEVTKRLPAAIQIVARRKLRMLNSARRLDDLRIPPANRLEALKGERKPAPAGSKPGGQYSIRINEIVLRKRAITADTALRLAAFFGTSEGFWLGLQADFDLEQTRHTIKQDLLQAEQSRAEYRIASRKTARTKAAA